MDELIQLAERLKAVGVDAAAGFWKTRLENIVAASPLDSRSDSLGKPSSQTLATVNRNHILAKAEPHFPLPTTLRVQEFMEFVARTFTQAQTSRDDELLFTIWETYHRGKRTEERSVGKKWFSTSRTRG